MKFKFLSISYKKSLNDFKPILKHHIKVDLASMLKLILGFRWNYKYNSNAHDYVNFFIFKPPFMFIVYLLRNSDGMNLIG